MLEILNYDFMRRAFTVGFMVALICPTVGIFIVLRRLSMIGDTLSHVALAGVAVGMVGGVYPIYSALIFSILASLGIEVLRKNYRDYAELAIGIILSMGVGIATIFISLGSGNISILSYLFGSIALATDRDIILTLVLGAIIIISIIFLYRALFYIAFDEEMARVSGVAVKEINLYFMVLVSVAIAIAMQIVGILLVSSLMMVPVATGLQLAKSFKTAWFYSVIFALISVIIGLFLAFYGDLAPGGTIVISGVGILFITILIKNISKAY
mgnify:CR=1 FL=1